MTKLKDIIKRAESGYDNLETAFEAVEEKAYSRWVRGLSRNTRLIFLLVVLAIVFTYSQMLSPPTDFPVGEIFTVSADKPLSDIAHDLEEAHVIKSALALRIVATLMGNEHTIIAGDYLLRSPKNVYQVARVIAAGTFGLEPIRIRIPEGATVRQMGDLFAIALPKFDKEHFLERALPMEGYLFPDTYFFLENAKSDQIIDTMHQNFLAHVSSIQDKIDTSGYTLDEIVIMASILEREARISKDRQMIAGVLWNRLAKGMLLQADATFRYINGKGSFDLTKQDLAGDSLYNTYKYKGLPPGAIGSPSLDSLTAAAAPIKNNYLFYLADNSGVTHYAKTYAEHLRFKRMYLGS
jgi:UPF0755 protein